MYALPLRIVSYRELYGWTMDEVVAEIGKKNNCTFCGVFRRQVSGGPYTREQDIHTFVRLPGPR